MQQGLGDATGDARDDLVLTSGDNLGQDHILVFAGPLQTGQALDAAVADIVLTLHEDISAIAFGDVLGDARPDLILGSRDAEEVYVVSPGSVVDGEAAIPDVASRRVIGDTRRQLGWDEGSGDLDGDQRGDLIMGTWQLMDPTVSNDANEQDIGRVFVLYGGSAPDNCPGVTNTDQADIDADSIGDACDKCTQSAKPGQRDTDDDGIGNLCDPDVALPNDCAVNFLDLNVYKANFFASGDLDTDNNGDGQTNFLDLNVIKNFFFGPPGPSAPGCN